MRENELSLLRAEYDCQVTAFTTLLNTKAMLLKSRGDVFVGRFVGVSREFVVFKVRISDNMPRRNSFWTASIFIGEMASYKRWGDLSWAGLREQYQSCCSDAFCAWIGKSDDPEFALVGIKNITIEFSELLEKDKSIVAFGPKDPPMLYLQNLIDFVNDESSNVASAILDYTPMVESVWNPIKVYATDDFIAPILSALDDAPFVAIQGPPGTGKTYHITQLIAKLLPMGKSVLATSLANEALLVLAGMEHLKHDLSQGKISKTSITVDEHRELPTLVANRGNVCNPSPGHLSLATFYVSSGWAKDMLYTIPFDYVIVEEASQALLPMLAATQRLGKKIIFIGDQQQLPPIVQVNIDSINKCAWQPIIAGFDTICNNITMPTFMLCDTFRLPPRAAEFTGIFYNDALRSEKVELDVPTSIPELSTKGGPTILDMDLPIGDKKPPFALQTIIALAERILHERPHATIAVLSKFKDSVRELQRAFIQWIHSSDVPNNITIETVDRIQGMTVDYTIFFIPNASINFSLESTLFNVATSRARQCTVIVCDRMLLRHNMPATVRRFLMKAYESRLAVLLPRTTTSQQQPPQTMVLQQGDIRVTILGKIDLPEKKFKEIVPDKENIFIIDTNVFVQCPTIISKVGKYKVVIPTMVLEELDKLKLKPDINKSSLSTAVKNINRAFENNFSEMVDGDASLLPAGFDATKADCLILSVAIQYKAADSNPILLTSDNLLQSKALGLGITTISLKDFLLERKK